MKFFDFNIHLPLPEEKNVQIQIKSETDLCAAQLNGAFSVYEKEFSSVHGGNIMLFNDRVFSGPEQKSMAEFKTRVGSSIAVPAFTLLVNFRDKKRMEYLEEAIRFGISAIKFHSYVQKITEADFDSILPVCRYAVEHGLAICVDASFGTTGLYRYDNLKLVCFLIENLSKDAKIVILHSGGARVLEAMLIAMDHPNVFLETSFSLHFYKNSSVEQDHLFAYKKLGSKRLLYGSDFPYVSIEDSLNKSLVFFRENGFSESEAENIFYTNAIQITGRG